MAKIMSMLGLRIQNRLEDLRQNQTWLATQLELSPEAVSRWMKGDSNPSFLNLERLSKILKCSIGYLAGDIQDEEISEVVRLMESAPKESRKNVLAGVIAVLGSSGLESRSIKKASLSR